MGKKEELAKRRRQGQSNNASAASPIFEVEAKFGDVLNKFISASEPYKLDEMEACVKKVCESHKLDFAKSVHISDNKENLEKQIKAIKDQLEKSSETIFCIYGQKAKYWILFYFVQSSNKTSTILYKDPCGAFMSSDIEECLKIFPTPPKVVTHTVNDLMREDDTYFGPVTIRNLEMILSCGWINQNAIENFPTKKFTNGEDICRDKFTLADNFAQDLSKNEKFLKDLRELVDKMPVKAKEKVADYEFQLSEELKKDEDNIDVNRLEKLRDMMFNDPHIKKMQEDHKDMCVKENGKITDFQLQIDKDYKTEMTKLSNIFFIIDRCRRYHGTLKDQLKHIQACIKLTNEEIGMICKAKEEREREKEKAVGWSTSTKEQDKKCRDLTTILKEATLGMDPKDPNQISTPSAEDIKKFETRVELVWKKYNETWIKATPDEITTWAKNKRGLLKNDPDSICEAIAVMNRATALQPYPNGYSLRITQILAVLIFFHDCDTAGKLCQIKTGEGKTLIVSLLAGIRVLQGYTVDVITSNICLATDGVNETKNFFQLLNITVSTNEVPNSYKSDVLYGTISKFQFDYLRDLTEGTSLRDSRKFQQVVLDEVDSMLVDNGGNIAKLSSSFPGMDCLRYIYIKIWKELYKARTAYGKEVKSNIDNFYEENKNVDYTERQKKYKHLMDTILENEIRVITANLKEIKVGELLDYPLIPEHLKKYCESRVNVWIENAVSAMYTSNINQQYRIVNLKRNDVTEDFIAPVDFSNTGVTLQNTIWSNGLHQFVQLKHNLQLTYESLTSSYISNLGFIRLYPKNMIFGLTGTLGSRSEQELLNGIYGVKYAKLPTFKPKIFEEEKGLVVEDTLWAANVVKDINEKVQKDRAVLVICETIKDLNDINETFKTLKSQGKIRCKEDPKIFSKEEDNVEATKGKLTQGSVVLATNIAGRGTNFRTEDNLEKKGGLHVCVTFLPCNLRVEEQAFGRTSRAGHSGTARLIIRQSDVDEMMIQTTEFDKIKSKRDALEKDRIEKIKAELVPELTFKDRIFDEFCKFCNELKLKGGIAEIKIIVKDLKECWAFWLEEKSYKADNIKDKNPTTEFQKFKHSDKVTKLQLGQIAHNPFYCIDLAKRHKAKNKTNEAVAALKRALELDKCTIAGAHLKLFELVILSVNQLLQRCVEMVKSLFGMDISTPAYKTEAVHHLQEARKIMKTEIKYIEDNLSADMNNPKAKDFINILSTESGPKNTFVKHIHSRLSCLQIHCGNIDELLKDCDKFHGCDFQARVETDIELFGKVAKLGKNDKVKDYFTNTETDELHSIGVDTIYSLKNIVGIGESFLKYALCFIAAGLVALVSGLAFLPIFPLMSNIAGTLISEGIVDIVMRVLVANQDNFSPAAYAKGKFMQIGKAVLSFGIGAIVQSAEILKKAVAFCRKIKTALCKCTYLKDVCTKLVTQIEKLGNFLQRKLDLEIFNKMKNQLDKAAEMLRIKDIDPKIYEKLGGDKVYEGYQKIQDGAEKTSRAALAVGFAREVGIKTAKMLVNSITKEYVLKPFMKNAVDTKITECIQNEFYKYYNTCENLKKKLRTTNDDIYDCVNSYVDNEIGKLKSNTDLTTSVTNFYKEHENALKNAGVSDAEVEAFEKVGEWAQLLHSFATFMKNIAIISTYKSGAAKYLTNKLGNGSSDNDVSSAITTISNKLATPVIDIVLTSWDSANEFRGQIDITLYHTSNKEKKT